MKTFKIFLAGLTIFVVLIYEVKILFILFRNPILWRRITRENNTFKHAELVYNTFKHRKPVAHSGQYSGGLHMVSHSDKSNIERKEWTQRTRTKITAIWQWF